MALTEEQRQENKKSMTKYMSVVWYAPRQEDNKK